MRGSILHIALLAGLAPAVLAAVPANAGSKGTAAFIGGAVVGAAVVGAISASHKAPKVVYAPGYVAPPPAYDPYWAGAMSPKPGITCYPAQQACYNAGGGYSKNWTWRIYAR